MQPLDPFIPADQDYMSAVCMLVYLVVLLCQLVAPDVPEPSEGP